MSLAGDSILVTPGTGATVATELISSKEYQAVIPCSSNGHLVGSRPVYVYNINYQVHVAAASTIHWDMFNADSTLVVRVLSIRQKPDMVTAVTGVAFAWTFARTTAVGTGGSAQTAVQMDTSETALSANITCRSKPTGGATAGSTIETFQVHGEETNAGTMILASMGGRQLIPDNLTNPISEKGIVLRQNQGLSVTQTTNSAAGNTGWTIVFTVE